MYLHTYTHTSGGSESAIERGEGGGGNNIRPKATNILCAVQQYIVVKIGIVTP